MEEEKKDKQKSKIDDYASKQKGNEEKQKEENAKEFKLSADKLNELIKIAEQNKELVIENQNFKQRINLLEEELRNMRHEFAKTIQANVKSLENASSNSILKFAEGVIEVKDSLDILDDRMQHYEKELQELKENAPKAWSAVDVLQAVHKVAYVMFSNVLLRNNIKEIETKVGDKFNAEIHEAIVAVPAEKEEDSGKITKIIKKGYIIKERVMRPTVVVATQKKE